MNVTRKTIGIIIMLFLFILIVGIWAWRFFFAHKTAGRIEGNSGEEFNITPYQSAVDKDEDGIDDQTDILQNAIDYINTAPKYKSKYYEGGYPTDGYGVCTDVVAFSLRDAGYDLQKLVHDDILKYPDEYDVDEPDDNIDFRRVRNLLVYFSHTAIPLTTDLEKKEEWQGGDIVIFQKHIGIVSDRRNENGVPYVIHHNSPNQKSYEEDILEKRTDLVAHYRIS